MSGARVCDIEGCDRKHLSRGKCRSHYQSPREISGEILKHPKHPTPCAVCGVLVMKGRTNTRQVVCSTVCRTELTWAPTRTTRRLVSALRAARAADRADERRLTRIAREAGKMPKGGFMYLKACILCGVGFGDVGLTSVACLSCRPNMKKHFRDKRRARVYNAYDGPVVSLEVFAAANYRCLFCGLALNMRQQGTSEPAAPTIEHVIPIARGGRHSMANVDAAHHLCNSVAGDRSRESFDLTGAQRVRLLASIAEATSPNTGADLR